MITCIHTYESLENRISIIIILERKNKMKKAKQFLFTPLTICMTTCIMIYSAFIFTICAVNSDDSVSEDIMNIEELQPMRAGTGDQYANRYFETLAQAQAYYGRDFTYTACTPFNQAPGCYGGYWSDGGTYNYYYTFSDGSRCYIHVGV